MITWIISQASHCEKSRSPEPLDQYTIDVELDSGEGEEFPGAHRGHRKDGDRDRSGGTACGASLGGAGVPATVEADEVHQIEMLWDHVAAPIARGKDISTVVRRPGALLRMERLQLDRLAPASEIPDAASTQLHSGTPTQRDRVSPKRQTVPVYFE